ncbi:MAG TPA: DUF6250 domain-containing protein [Puia sp.]|nr:DUF6250 domain-containing protein [Puia sp.]
MKKSALLTLLLSLYLMRVSATVFYVAPDGNDANPGTKEKPLATIQKAQSRISAGDTVYIRGGVYHMTEAQIARTERNYACVTYLDKSGKRGKYILYSAYPGERPVFDYSAIRPADYRVAAFYVTGSWLHLRGFEVTGVQVTIKTHTQSECFENHGSNNIYEQLSMHDGMAIGFYLLSGSDNLILNCDAYRNFDSVSENHRGGNTDGFGCHPAEGSKGNVFRGCRSWFNSDDGYDVINSHEATTFDHCWAFYNGYDPTFTSQGDGNGFKGGGYGRRPADEIPSPVPQTTVRFCLAVRNKASGFYSNHHINGSFWINNTAYENHINFNMLNRLPDNVTDVPGYKHVMRNNLGYKARGAAVANLDTAQCELVNNYFDLPATDEDFESLDETQLTAPRKADGSLPDITFMHLRPGGRFGNLQNVGAFAGEAPVGGTGGSGRPGAQDAGKAAPQRLIFSDDFNAPLDPRVWVAEVEPKQGSVSSVYTQDGALVLNTRGGVTVWLNKRLHGDLRIEYDREVLVDTGKNDRLSDMNVFWMASDPNNANLFTRSGRFKSYDDLQLYYVGMGGNTNKTTRFRKYYSGGRKPVIKEYLDAAHLLQPNRPYHIEILVNSGTTSYWVDGERYFSYTDPMPLKDGYFGFRSTWSRQRIGHLRIWEAQN